MPETTTVDRGEWMQTFTGRSFYLLDPRVDDIDPVDIGHALGMLCRYGGHTSVFYSVAEHCVLMSYAVAPENALQALLHDATEAYLNDLIRPLKQVLPEYRRVEDRLALVICDRFGVRYERPAEVKEADRRILQDERAVLMSTPDQPWGSLEGVQPLGVRIEGWPPAQAKAEYLHRLAELTAWS